MTRFKKYLIPLLVISFVFFLFSCNDGETKKDEVKVEEPAKMETPVATVFTPFKVFMVQHSVADFEKWKAAYLAHDSFRLAYGITHYVMGRGMDDPNWVVVIDKIGDVQKAKDFASAPALKDAMQKAGVKGKPMVSMAEVIRNEDTKIDQQDRVMIVHHVKDFDTWLKVYDAEGVAKRLEYGLIDRGLARDVDDPNKVYIVFAITDMAKAKARMGSQELKKIMTDAGVDGPPQINFYKLVD